MIAMVSRGGGLRVDSYSLLRLWYTGIINLMQFRPSHKFIKTHGVITVESEPVGIQNAASFRSADSLWT